MSQGQLSEVEELCCGAERGRHGRQGVRGESCRQRRWAHSVLPLQWRAVDGSKEAGQGGAGEPSSWSAVSRARAACACVCVCVCCTLCMQCMFVYMWGLGVYVYGVCVYMVCMCVC